MPLQECKTDTVLSGSEGPRQGKGKIKIKKGLFSSLLGCLTMQLTDLVLSSPVWPSIVIILLLRLLQCWNYRQSCFYFPLRQKFGFTIYVSIIPNLGINSMLENMTETYNGKTNH